MTVPVCVPNYGLQTVACIKPARVSTRVAMYRSTGYFVSRYACVQVIIIACNIGVRENGICYFALHPTELVWCLCQRCGWRLALYALPLYLCDGVYSFLYVS